MSDQKSYAISAGHKDTLEAAQIILEDGGNAVDAAISAFLVSMVSEPCMSSPGGGGIALIKDTNNSIFSCDFFCQTPQNKISRDKEHFYPVTIDFGEATEDFYIGAGSIAVPGSIAGIYSLHEKFGKVPLKELFEPAISKAKNGSTVDRFQAFDIQLLENILNQSKHGCSLFYDDKKLKKEGDILRFTRMADFFEVLSIEGKRLFYEGEIADSIHKISKESGGHLRRSDLENYHAKVNPAYRFPIRDYQVYTGGFPSRGGPLIAAFLDSINTFNIGEALSQSHLKELKIALKTALELKANRDKRNAFLFERFGLNIHEEKSTKSGGTTHFSIQDSEGMAISLTTTLGEGCGLWVESADIQLNNMLGEEALMENGFYNWVPDTRLMTMMTPTIVNKNTDWLVTGSGGAGRIPFAIGHLVHYIFDLNFGLKEATVMPRTFYQKGHFEIENGFNLHLEDDEKHWSTQSLFFGGTNSIFSDAKTNIAVADQRRFGSAYF